MTERERLVKLIDRSPAHFCDGCKEVPEERAESIEKLADYLIASDVVEVVRCKDCTHYGRKYGDTVIGYCCHTKQSGYCAGDHYCSYGERREK